MHDHAVILSDGRYLWVAYRGTAQMCSTVACLWVNSRPDMSVSISLKGYGYDF